MRTTLSLVAVALTVGCATQVPEPERLRVESEQLARLGVRSSLDWNVWGLAVSGDGRHAAVGLRGSTCTVSTSDAFNMVDEDVVDDAVEVVTDVQGDDVLVIVPDGLVHTDLDIREAVTVPLPGVQDAAFTPDGVVSLEASPEGCVVRWHGERSVRVPADVCDAGQLEVVDETTVLVASWTEVGVVAEDYRSLAKGDLFTWDAVHEVAYVASSGARELAAVDLAGDEVWRRQLGARVRAIDAVGTHGGLAAYVRNREQGRSIAVISPAGEVMGWTWVPARGDVRLDVSDDGSTVAVAWDQTLAFYDLSFGLP
jgi:hypothetical protein